METKDTAETTAEDKKQPKMPVIRLGILAVVAAFALGLFWPTIVEWFNPGPQTATAPRITMPKEGVSIQTDEFSVRLFQYYLKRIPTGNLVVTPNNVTQCLNELKKLTTEENAVLFDPLHLCDKATQSSASIHEGSLLFCNRADVKPGQRENEAVFTAAFSTDLAMAHQEINSAVTAYTNGAITHMFSGASAPRGTRMLAAAVTAFQAAWYYPFFQHFTEEKVFHNADATRPRVSFMKADGNFRTVADPQGKWKAVALFMRNTPQGDADGTDSCALILILPTDADILSARPLATGLTAQDYSAIRTALAQAEEKPATILLPRIRELAGRLDMFPALHAMGLGALTKADAAPFPALSDATPFPLDGFYQQNVFFFCESADNVAVPAALEPSEKTLEFNRPFIWMLCPLTSPTPPYAMGVQEYM